MTDPGTAASACAVCGSVYPDPADAVRCRAFPAEADELARGTLVRVRAAGAGTGLGWVRGSFLLGLDDPRGAPHTRFYRANFLWGRADFRIGDLE